ncbi:uncharacterized protein LOC116180821 isoform X2 [Photinus pyralis]|uniref:uncharacterized protein LOC116177678 isoform X2 n=1 Tax=Photinus pyralis TaxID=7054 RepID=UPI001267695F|nr:uncharacterized protein LOC116177678 isoform X2 [Photinus pyralis]XP_031356840.1 uncharacterized protein LOC116180821 isoform X2 [Photinus pyralis]
MEGTLMDAKLKVTPRRHVRDVLCKIWKGITVEPVLILFMLPFHMSALTIQNLSLEKSCRVNLNMSDSVCDAIHQRDRSGYNDDDEVAVQKVVAAAYVWKFVVYGVFPAILLPFLGSWSDRNKTRKILLLLPIIGELITNIAFIFCTYYFYELPMEVNTLVEVLPTAITGGSNMLFLGVFTHVSAISSSEDRTFRIGIVHTLFCICVTIGSALSGVIYKGIGFYGVFSLSLVLYALAGLYAYYKVKEEAPIEKKTRTKYELMKDIVNIKKTLSTFHFLIQPNRGIQRKQIFVIVLLAIFVLGPFAGEGALLYLYTRLKFNWNEIDCSIYFGYTSVAHLTGNFAAILIFSKWLKFDDAVLGAISSVSKICGGIVFMLAEKSFVFYIGALIEAFNGTSFVASRSIITKLVEEKDLGITLTIPAILLYLWLYSKRNERFVEEDFKFPESRELFSPENRNRD